MTKWEPGDRVTIKEGLLKDRQGSVVFGDYVEGMLLIRLDRRFRSRLTYMHHINDLEFEKEERPYENLQNFC